MALKLCLDTPEVEIPQRSLIALDTPEVELEVELPKRSLITHCSLPNLSQHLSNAVMEHKLRRAFHLSLPLVNDHKMLSVIHMRQLRS